MSARSRTPDDAKTAIYDPKRAKSETQRGTPSGIHTVEPEPTTDVDPTRPIEQATPTEVTPARERSEPLRVISMKDAGAPAAKPEREVPKPKLRALSEVSSRMTPPRGMGYLAPPRDPKEVRARRVRDNVIWGALAVILACGVTLAIWFLAR